VRVNPGEPCDTEIRQSYSALRYDLFTQKERQPQMHNSPLWCIEHDRCFDRRRQFAAGLNEENEWSVTGQTFLTCPLHPYVFVVIINNTHPNINIFYLSNDAMLVDLSSS